jgi:hypothetical protein
MLGLWWSGGDCFVNYLLFSQYMIPYYFAFLLPLTNPKSSKKDNEKGYFDNMANENNRILLSWF